MRRWTDGKVHAPGLPSPPPVVKCDVCGGCYFLDDAEVIGEVDTGRGTSGGAPEDWHEGPRVEEPSEAEYYKAIRSGLARDRRQERLLRIRAWWRSNDAHRTEDESAKSAREFAEMIERNRDLLRESAESLNDATRERFFQRDPSLRRQETRRPGRSPDGPPEVPTQAEREENLRALLPLLDEADTDDLIMNAEGLRESGRWQEAEDVLNKVQSREYEPVLEQFRALCAAADPIVRELHYASGPWLNAPYTHFKA